MGPSLAYMHFDGIDGVGDVVGDAHAVGSVVAPVAAAVYADVATAVAAAVAPAVHVDAVGDDADAANAVDGDYNAGRVSFCSH